MENLYASARRLDVFAPNKDEVLKHIGELSLNNFSLIKEIELRDQEIAKLRAMVEKLSGQDRAGMVN